MRAFNIEFNAIFVELKDRIAIIFKRAIFKMIFTFYEISFNSLMR